MQPFHLAIPVNNLEKAKEFYTKLFHCTIGRQCDKWIDFDFFGHQLSVHLNPEEIFQIKSNKVDDKSVPVRHFGIVLEWHQWHELAESLTSLNTVFIIEPYIRFKGEVGEQATMFLADPSGNAIEFKSFKDMSQLFANKAI